MVCKKKNKTCTKRTKRTSCKKKNKVCKKASKESLITAKVCKKSPPIVVRKCPPKDCKPVCDPPDRTYEITQDVKILNNSIDMLSKILENLTLVLSTFCIIESNSMLVNRILYHTHSLYKDILEIMECLSEQLTLYFKCNLEICKNIIWDIICEAHEAKDEHHYLIVINKKNNQMLQVMKFQRDILSKKLVNEFADKMC